MATRLRDLIKAVRACKTSAEERALIAKESAAIRGSLKESDAAYRHRNVAKLMFMHMLGYPTHFGQMECVRLIAANRIGYLGLMILLDERQEVTMLVTNSIKNDLSHKNHFIVGLALCSLGNICTAEMARDVAPEVSALLGSKNSYVRKKAALCSIRVIKKVPELAEQFMEGAENLLSDRHHGVLLCAVTLALTLCAVDPANVAAFRKHTNALVRILKSLIHSGYSAEHDVGGHADPFLQVKLLRLLRVLGSGDPEASDAMSDVLAGVASNTDGSKNAGNAILYEAVNAIIGVESIGGLRVLAINILGRFLANKDNNIRYVALNTLAKVVAVDTQAVQRHRHTIVECVKDSDVTIRRSALQLVYNLVNENNITTLAKELLDYLTVADPEFKTDLTRRIAMLVESFAPDKRWHVDTLTELLVRGGSYVSDDECRGFIQLITATPELQGYAGRALYRAAHEERAHFQVAAVAAWVLGEYGDAVVNASANRLDGEAGLVVQPRDVVALLASILGDVHTPGPVKQVAVTALGKLSTRFPEETGAVRSAVEKVGTTLDLELQQRASEFVKIFERGPALAAPLLERMPPFERKTPAAFTRPGSGVTARGGAPAAAPEPAADLLGDLMGLDDGSTSEAASQRVSGGGGGGGGAASSRAGADLLGDLMGGGGGEGGVINAAAASADPLADLLGGAYNDPGSAAPTPPPTSAAPDPILDLMGGGSHGTLPSGGGAGPAASPAGVTKPTTPVDPMMDLMGSLASDPMGGAPVHATVTPAMGMGATAAAGAAAGLSIPIVAFQRDGLTVSFTCAKPDPVNNPGATTVTASFTNASPAPVVGFTLQVAMPKTMTLALEPASGSDIAPHGGVVKQVLRVVNGQHGERAIAMRLRMTWSAGGSTVTEQAAVTFPPDI